MSTAERLVRLLRELDALERSSHNLHEFCDRLGAWLSPTFQGAAVFVVAEGQDEEGRGARSCDGEPSLSTRPLCWGDRRVGQLSTSGEPHEPLWGDLQLHLARSLATALDRDLLRHRNLELELVYKIDRIRDGASPFPDMVHAALGELLQGVPAEFVALAVAGAGTDQGTPKFDLHIHAAPGQRQATAEFLQAHRVRLMDAVHRVLESADEPLVLPGRELISLPLRRDGEPLGALLVVSPPGGRFTSRERRLMAGVWSQVDSSIFAHVSMTQLRNIFRRYVSRDVAHELLQQRDTTLSGRRVEVTCLFSDLRGFTGVSEQLDVDTIVQMLNQHLAEMTQIVFEYGGTVDKFIGDCVMAVFGAPLHQPDHALRAVTCAHHMRARQQQLAQEWLRRGLPPVKIGIGMTTGVVFAGTIGSDALASHTVIGDHVNLAARLEGQSGPDDIILSAATLQKVQDFVEVEPRGEITVKGKSTATPIYNLLRVVSEPWALRDDRSAGDEG